MDDLNNDHSTETAGFPDPPDLEGLPSALERLGASPFPKSGFPLLGFLATLYDQVTQAAKAQSPRRQSGGESSSE